MLLKDQPDLTSVFNGLYFARNHQLLKEYILNYLRAWP